MPSAVAINLAAGYKKYTEESNQKRDQFLEERRMLSTIGPKRWAELRTLFQQTVADMNNELGYMLLEFQDVSSNTLRVTKSNGALVLNGLYDPDKNTLDVSSQPGCVSFSYEQKVLGSDVAFVTTRRSENGPRSADEIVEAVVKQFLYTFVAG